MKKSYSKSGPKPGYPSWEVGRRTGNGGFSRAAVRAGAAAVGRAKKEASEGAAPSDVRPTDCELRLVSLREGEGLAPQKVAGGGGDSGGGMQSAAPISGQNGGGEASMQR